MISPSSAARSRRKLSRRDKPRRNPAKRSSWTCRRLVGRLPRLRPQALPRRRRRLAQNIRSHKNGPRRAKKCNRVLGQERPRPPDRNRKPNRRPLRRQSPSRPRRSSLRPNRSRLQGSNPSRPRPNRSRRRGLSQSQPPLPLRRHESSLNRRLHPRRLDSRNLNRLLPRNRRTRRISNRECDTTRPPKSLKTSEVLFLMSRPAHAVSGHLNDGFLRDRAARPRVERGRVVGHSAEQFVLPGFSPPL
jgi:hypothetical protein